MVVSYSLETFYSSLFLRNLLLCSQEPLLNFILAAILLKINSKPTCVISHQCCRCISVPYFSLIYIYAEYVQARCGLLHFGYLSVCLSVCLLSGCMENSDFYCTGFCDISYLGFYILMFGCCCLVFGINMVN